MSRHLIAQPHEPSGRTSLYVGAHMHHVEGLDGGPPTETTVATEASDALVRRLNEHVTQDKYVVSVGWDAPGDLVAWDNRAVLHRATGGEFEGKWKRDMRRTTVHDDGPRAWGVNKIGEEMPGFASDSRPGEKPVAVSVK